MSKVNPRLPAKKLSDGTVVIKGGNLRKLRDPKSGQYTSETYLPDGSTGYKTASGQIYKTTKF